MYGEDFEITPAEADMLDSLCELERACFDDPWDRSAFEASLDRERHVSLCAVSQGRVVGFAGFMFVLDEGYITNVAVAPDMRRRGAAKRLMEALAERARAMGLSFLSLEARKSNLAAIALYSKLGYTRRGEMRGYYEKPREDAVVMTLDLAGTGDRV